MRGEEDAKIDENGAGGSDSEYGRGRGGKDGPERGADGVSGNVGLVRHGGEELVGNGDRKATQGHTTILHQLANGGVEGWEWG